MNIYSNITQTSNYFDHNQDLLHIDTNLRIQFILIKLSFFHIKMTKSMLNQSIFDQTLMAFLPFQPY